MKKVTEERPDPLALLRQLAGDGGRRAGLRVYLGYARGCGTTTAMLDEARRRRGRGTDVVVAAYRVHGEPQEALAGLEMVPGTQPPPAQLRLDLDAVLARNPEVVCIDDLVGLDRAGRVRLDDVPRLIKAGITVLATLHVLSVRSEAEAVSGMLGEAYPGSVPQGPVLDDEVLEVIDELEVVDIPPADLLDRIREQAILTPAELAMAMQRELRPAVLRLLREAALRMIAEHTDRQLEGLLRDSAGQPAPEVHNRIVLCLSIRPGLEDRIRSIGRVAAAQDAKLYVVTVRTHPLTDRERAIIGSYAAVTHQVHGEFVRLEGRAVAPVLAQFIKDTMATEVILGHRRRRRWRPWDTASELIRLLAGVDVHVLRSPG
jgi:two-component system, OmpR family, sensor histidine kinase KdpD